MAVHDSKTNWEEFRDNVLMPRLNARHPRWFQRTATRNLVRGS